MTGEVVVRRPGFEAVPFAPATRAHEAYTVLRHKTFDGGKRGTMFRKALLTTAAAIAMLALSSVARADSFTITGVNGTGVTAQISNYSLAGNTFTFTIQNTSVAPGSTGTITNIGFA